MNFSVAKFNIKKQHDIHVEGSEPKDKINQMSISWSYGIGEGVVVI